MSVATGSGRALSLRVDHGQVSTVMRLEGELDISGVESLRRGLGRGVDGKEVVVDLRRLTFLDSMGLSALLEFALRATGPVTLIRGPQQVHRVFQIIGTESRFDWTTPHPI